jgi:hypothetical protein
VTSLQESEVSEAIAAVTEQQNNTPGASQATNRAYIRIIARNNISVLSD